MKKLFRKKNELPYTVVENRQWAHITDPRIFELMMELQKANFLHKNELRHIIELAESIFEVNDPTKIKRLK